MIEAPGALCRVLMPQRFLDTRQGCLGIGDWGCGLRDG